MNLIANTPFKAEQVYFAGQTLEGENEPDNQGPVGVNAKKRLTCCMKYQGNGHVAAIVDYEASPNDLEQL